MSTGERRSSMRRVSENVLEFVEILRGEKKDTSSSSDDDEYCKPWYSKKITKKIAKCSVAGGAVVAIGGLCYKGRRRLLNAGDFSKFCRLLEIATPEHNSPVPENSPDTATLSNEKQFLEAVKDFTEKCPQHFIDFVKNCNENEACYQDELDGQKLRIDENACFIYQDSEHGDVDHVGVSAVDLNSSQSHRFVNTRTNHYNWDQPEKTKFESFRVLTSHMELKSLIRTANCRCGSCQDTLDRCWESANPKTFAPDGTLTHTSDAVWNHVYLEEKYAEFKKYLKAAEDFWSLNES